MLGQGTIGKCQAYARACAGNSFWARKRKRQVESAKFLHVQAAAFNNAFQGANGDSLAAMQGHNYLTAILVPSLLVAASLPDHHKSMPAQNRDDVICTANSSPSGR
jgi:hypothetical protein